MRNEVDFISGGCGGFGLAVARLFRNKGYIVGLGDLRPPAAPSSTSTH
ncbi:hypothetical protein [Corynebacterium striatum]|nr:hypothetical protein [Corynebacterium striatum]